MARPLALAGFGSLALLLLCIHYLPSAAFLPLAVLLLVAASVVLLFSVMKRRKYSAVLILLLALGLAALRLYWQQQSIVELHQLVDEKTHTIEGSVREVGDGLYANVYSAELKVTSLDGRACRPFVVSCGNVETAEVGQILRLTVEFDAFAGSYRIGKYSQGVILSALQEDAGAEIVVGEDNGILMSIARFRRTLGSRFMVLGRSTGGTAAAMVVGDRARLDEAVQQQYRLAGVSHMLVVSGLHLSFLTAVLSRIFRFLLRGGRASSVLLMLAVGLYMLLIGLTPSIIRAGVLSILALAAPLFDRTADSINSMGAALLLLLFANPYAVCDPGLLLSFCATLGVLCFGTLDTRHFHLKGRGRLGSMASTLGTTFFAALFTLPVLAWNGTTVSAGTLLANLLCVPFVLPVMLCGSVFLVTHLLLNSSKLLLTGRLLYFLLRVMEEIVGWINRVFDARLGVSGWIAVVILCCAGAITWIFYESRLRRFCAVAGIAALLLFCGASAALNARTVRVALVGGGINPAVVISSDGECAVLYRGKRSNLDDVQQYLALHNLRQPQFVADLSDNGYGSTITQSLGRMDLCVREDVGYLHSVACLDTVQLTFVRQKSGCLCYIEVDGYSIGVSSGPVDCSSYPACSVFLAGYSHPQGLQTDRIVSGEKIPAWVAERPEFSVCFGEEPVVWVRPGKVMRVLQAKEQQA